MNEILRRLHVLYHTRERGQTMAEYVVVLGIISVAIMLALGAVGSSVSGALGRATSTI